jgi:hypothetical protein
MAFNASKETKVTTNLDHLMDVDMLLGLSCVGSSA